MSEASLRAEVIHRAHGRCEYCQLAQAGQEAVFHIDHVKPRIVGGATTLDNLALACVSCSLRKGARERAIDSLTGLLERLFNPRKDNWAEHFQWSEEKVVPLTAIGRATIEALSMNRPMIQAIRREEMLSGRHPPR